MKKVLSLLIMAHFYGGCSIIEHNLKTQELGNKSLSCTLEVEKKSLEFLEQQYRCKKK